MSWLPHRAVSNSLGAGREPVLLRPPRRTARNGRFPCRRGIGSRLASTESETAVKLCMDLGFSGDYCSDLRLAYLYAKRGYCSTLSFKQRWETESIFVMLKHQKYIYPPG